MFNLVVLTGRLTAEPELKKTPSDVSVCNFSIAVQRAYKSGEEPITDFINIVAWRNTAEFICKYFQKGAMIGIEGSIQTRKYQDNEGKNRTAFEVLATNVQFVGDKKSNNNSVDVQGPDPLAQVQDNLNAAGFKPTEDDDLPF